MITVIGNLKGGTGKSTVCFNLAVWLELTGTPVSILDLDPQGTLSDVIDVRTEDDHEPRLTVNRGAKALDILARRPEMVAESEVLVDVGTADMKALKRAVRFADRIVMPVAPSQADVWSTQRFVDLILSTSTKKKSLSVFSFINRADTHHMVLESDQAADALSQLEGAEFIVPRLCQRTVYRRSLSEGLAVFELKPTGKAAVEVEKLARFLYP